MPCCHADFALTENGDRAFTVGMPTFTFGAGCLAEAGDQARELGLSRIALFTDATSSDSAHVAAVLASLNAAGIGVTVYNEIVVEPTTASFQAAARFAAEGRFDGYVSVGGGSVMDTCKATNLYATHPAEFMTYVNAPIGGGQGVPGPLKPHIACPTTSGTGSETTGIAIFNLTEINAKTGIISRRLIPTVALIDPEVTATLPRSVVAASGFDCMSHALESLTARPWPRRLNPARGTSRPVSQGANPFSDGLATEALKGAGKYLVRAVSDASDIEARTEMMYAAMLAGIAFNAAGCHLPHGLSYPVSGLTRDFHLPGYPAGKTLVPRSLEHLRREEHSTSGVVKRGIPMSRLASTLFLLLLCGAASAAPFQNGSFERGPIGPCNIFNIPAGSTLIPGWTVSVGNIDWEGPPPCGWLASQKNKSLDLVGDAAGGIGGIQQTFDTVPGATYRVSFDLAGNYGGLPVVKPLAVTVNGVTNNYTFDTIGKSQFNMGWTKITFKFVASSTTSTISFVSDTSGLGGINAGAAIDNVQVVRKKLLP